MCEGVQLYVTVGHVYIYYQVDSAAEAAASVAVGTSMAKSKLEQQLEHAHAQVT